MSSIEDVVPLATAWSTARIIEKEQPTADTVRLRMLVEDRQHHAPGQHYVVRLRAPDDYTAQRSYSVASADHDPLLELLVERLPGGEVSGHLADVAEVGDVLEVRGPIGRWFVWDGRTPSLAVVGGTGVVPAVAMLRTARHLGGADLLRVLAVGRDPRALPYVDELTRAGATVLYTRHDAGGRTHGPPATDEVAPLLAGVERSYVCGSPRFAGLAESLLLACDVDATTIRVEQFGATG